MAESRFVQNIGDEARAQLTETRDGGAPRPLTRDYVVVSGGVLVGIRDGVGVLLKWLARALYLSPAIVIAKVVLSGLAAAVAVAAFVCVVLAFFVVLIVYIVAAFVAFGQNARRRLSCPDAISGRAATGEPDTADLGRQVTVRGRVVKLRGPSSVVMSDAWGESMRVTYADVFGVLRSAGLPVVVLPTTAPTLVAPNGSDEPRALAEVTEAEARTRMLREGDEVIVTGQLLDRITNVHAFELDGEVLRLGGDTPDEAAPYREAQILGGLLVSDTLATPLTIKVVARG